MCECMSSTPIAATTVEFRKLGFSRFNFISTKESIHVFYARNDFRYLKLRFSNVAFKPSTRATRLGSEEFQFYTQDKGEEQVEFESSRSFDLESTIQNGIGSSDASADKAELNMLESEGGLEDDDQSGKSNGTSQEEEDLVSIEGFDNVGLRREELGQLNERAEAGLRRGREVIKRSNILAKQVISIQSALSLGFVSQLWVDTTSWVVLFLEVRPSLLSGEAERFLLEDVSQVGDVVLIKDENVVMNDFKMVGLETLVGYKVVTVARQNIGKVRGYTFNIISGAIESLELDSFGISVIPSSLVSTYALFVEDVLEVSADTVIVHEAAASRIQKLTKGFWDTQNAGASIDELGEYSEVERPVKSRHSQRLRRNFGSRKFRPKMRETETDDDWELPMDYL